MQSPLITSSLIGITSFVVSLLLLKPSKIVSKAICTFTGLGTVTFEQLKNNLVLVTYSLKNVAPGLHGLHVHMFGDLSGGCDSTCSHYNPTNKTHGGPLGSNRHRGDLGNIEASRDGIATGSFHANVNIDEIIGRALILHEDEDDLGQGGNDESLKTGNAGKRIACGVIGIAKL